MVVSPELTAPLAQLRPPYERIHPVIPDAPFIPAAAGSEGEALVWRLGVGNWKTAHEFARQRAPGTALILILPPAADLHGSESLLRAVEGCRPQSILPHHPELDLDELLSVLRRTPADLAIEFVDYLLWRGFRIDGETRQLVRRTIELSSHVRTVSGLSRAMYLSRRALGRRFMTRGIPVPSHWLHFARILRASLRLQAGDESLMTIAYDLGYSDGFTFSNQMRRLTGLRPSTVRRAFGWEWIVEAWLTRELASGGLSSRLQPRLTPPLRSLRDVPSGVGPGRADPVPEAEPVAVLPLRPGQSPLSASS
ncbi:MAG: helix-turn-helix transcriptional regulator [Gemmatimonadota bacterium]|nr:MAG: helix-turn-helix transcriptional regulator [Gemmatimonadota bacterium]